MQILNISGWVTETVDGLELHGRIVMSWMSSFILGFCILILDECTVYFSLPDIISTHYSLSNWSMVLIWSLFFLYWSLQTTEIAYEICEVLTMVSRSWCYQKIILPLSLGSKKSSTLTFWVLKLEATNSSEMSVNGWQCWMKQLNIYVCIYIYIFLTCFIFNHHWRELGSLKCMWNVNVNINYLLTNTLPYPRIL